MTAKRGDIADLPNWPRGLSLEQAAAYAGFSVATFRLRVPVAPIRAGCRVIYDRAEIDRWFDSQREAGQGAPTGKAWLKALKDAHAAQGR
jgi:hypothetical protein